MCNGQVDAMSGHLGSIVFDKIGHLRYFFGRIAQKCEEKAKQANYNLADKHHC